MRRIKKRVSASDVTVSLLDHNDEGLDLGVF